MLGFRGFDCRQPESPLLLALLFLLFSSSFVALLCFWLEGVDPADLCRSAATFD